jgi:hypothetical protein
MRFDAVNHRTQQYQGLGPLVRLGFSLKCSSLKTHEAENAKQHDHQGDQDLDHDQTA